MTKKLLCLLFLIQLNAWSLYAVSVFNITNFNNQIYSGRAELSVASAGGKDVTEYDRDFLLNYLSEKDIDVAVRIYKDDYNLELYTSNPAIKKSLPTMGRIQTTLGQNPIASSIESFIFDTYPRINVTVFDINESPHIPIEGVYHISLTDINELNNLVEELNYNGIPAKVVYINEEPSYIYFLEIAFAFLVELEFGALHLFLFLCILILLVQYAISQLKYSTVLLVHGHSNTSIMKKTASKVLKLFIIPFIVSAMVFFLYGVFIIGCSVSYLFLLFLLFVAACFLLLCLYIGIIYMVIAAFLRSQRANNILKGNKNYFFVQACNYLLRVTFLIFLCVTLNPTIADIRFANQRIAMQPTWNRARHIYKTSYTGVGQHDRLDIEFYIIL